MRMPKPFHRKQTDSWYIELQPGKQERLLVDGAPIKGKGEKARQRAQAAYRTILEGRGLNASSSDSTTLHELVDSYLEWFKTHRSEYAHSLIKTWVLGPLRDAVSPTFLASNLTYRTVEKVVCTKRVKSPTTIHRRIGYIIGMYNWGMKPGRRLVTANPIEGIERPQPRNREAFIPPARFAELLELVKTLGQDFEDYVTVAFSSGARPQEMRMFEPCHFNAAERRFEYTTKGKRKGEEDRRRIVQLPNAAFDVVERRVEACPDGKIFRNSHGGPWTKDAIKLRFASLKIKFGMDGLCATVLRHSFAHYRLTQGQDPVIVATLMGHKDTRQIMQTYGHLIKSDFMNDQANEFSPV